MIDELHADFELRPCYDRVSIAVHWLTVLLLIALFAAAWAREDALADPDQLLLWHRSQGVLIWAVTVVRLAWQWAFATVPPAPATMSRAQRIAAKIVQGALYLLLLLMPVTGFVQSIAHGRSFPLLWFGDVPELMARNKLTTHFFHDLHQTGATVLLMLIGLHAVAGLFHGLVRRDSVLSSMLPGRIKSWGVRE